LSNEQQKLQVTRFRRIWLALNIITKPIIIEYNRIEDRQCTYNVKMRRGRITIVVVGKQLVLYIVSVCL